MSAYTSWAGVRLNGAGYAVSGSTTSHMFRPLVDYDLWFAWTGHARMRHGDALFPVAPGVIMCLRYGQQYESQFTVDNPLGHCFIHFDFLDPAGAVCHPQEGNLPPHYSRTPDIEFTYLTMRRIAELWRTGDPLRREEAEHYLHGLLLALRHDRQALDISSVELEHRHRIAELVHYVREDPARGFSVAEVAARGNYSPDYFTKVFKRIHGSTPTEFFIGIRLERACALLCETTLTVEQVADVLGYADVYFFSRQFKQHLGLPPSNWRRTMEHRNRSTRA